MSRRRAVHEVVVISWRDIPAQVNGRSGETRHQVVLPRRFQRAIDEAAMVAGKKTASEYVGEWRRHNHDIDGSTPDAMRAAVDACAAELVAEWTRERLQELVRTGGYLAAESEPT